MPAKPKSAKLGQLLLRAGVLDAQQLSLAVEEAERGAGSLLGLLVDRGVATEAQLVAALSRASGLPAVDLGQVSPTPQVLGLVDANACEERGILPLALADGGRTLLLATGDPTDIESVDFVAMSCRLRVRPHVAGERSLRQAIRRYYFNEELPAGTGSEFKLLDRAGKTLHPTQSTEASAAPADPGLERQLQALRTTVENQERMIRALMDALFQKQLLSAEDVLRARKASP